MSHPGAGNSEGLPTWENTAVLNHGVKISPLGEGSAVMLSLLFKTFSIAVCVFDRPDENKCDETQYLNGL